MSGAPLVIAVRDVSLLLEDANRDTASPNI
jgi:hypothetical protein